MTDWHASGGRDDRERINRARETAEDLFRPKRSAPPAEPKPADANPAVSADQQLPRQPRIMPIQHAAPTTSPANTEPPAEPTPQAPQIRAAQYGRVRALLSYGMTRAQVADLFKVPLTEVDRIVSRSGSRK